MMNHSNSITTETNAGHKLLHPGIVATVFIILFMASLVPVTLIMSDKHFPSPLQPPAEILVYFQTELSKVRITAFLQFCSAMVFGVFAVMMVNRMWHYRGNLLNVLIALFGGLTTSVFIALSALIQWTLTQPGVEDRASVTLSLYHLLVVTGGTGFSVPFGLFVAGISISSRASRLLPQWLVVSGIIVGIVGALSVLSLVIPNALHLVPLTRFPGFAWMIFAAFKLPRRRAEVTGYPHKDYDLEEV